MIRAFCYAFLLIGSFLSVKRNVKDPINTPVKPTYVSDPFDSFDYKADVNSSLVKNEKSVEESETKSSSGLKLKL